MLRIILICVLLCQILNQKVHFELLLSAESAQSILFRECMSAHETKRERERGREQERERK